MLFSSTLKSELGDKVNELLEEAVTDDDGVIHGVVAGVTDKNGPAYVGAKGILDIESKVPINDDTMVAYFSCTKTMTALAVLRLVDAKKIEFDVPAKQYLGALGDVGLIDAGTVDPSTGEFTVSPRQPQTQITIRHLLLHMSGFSYGFLSADLLALMKRHNISAVQATMKYFSTDINPLVAEPGSRFCYGIGFDWLGLIVQAVSGKSLGQYLHDEVFAPVGMTSCTFRVKDPSNLLRVHKRAKDGSLTKLNYNAVELDPEIDMGGQGCFGNARDFLKLLRIWLNKGYSPDGKVRILSEELTEYALKNHLPAGVVVHIDGSPPQPDGFDPDLFSLTGLAISTNDFPTGRPRGALYWAGLANLYFWIDPKNEVGGFWGAQILPQVDKSCLMNYLRFEYAVYETIEEATSKQKL